MNRSTYSTNENISQNCLSTALHKAVNNGDLQRVYQLCVMEGTDVNVTDENGNAALHLACLHKYTDICQLLIAGNGSYTVPEEKWAKINVVNARNLSTPLHYAATLNLVDVAKWILMRVSQEFSTEDKDKFINAQNINHQTALWLSIVYNASLEIVELLVDNGADITDKDGNSDKDTLLHVAIRCNNRAAVKYLLENNKNLRFARNNKGETPLSVSMSSKMDLYCFNTILSKVETKISDEYPDALIDAIKNDNMQTFKILLEKDADFLLKSDNWKTIHQDGRTILHLLAENRNKDFLNFLKDELNKRAVVFDVNAVDESGQTPFHVVAKNTSVDNMIILNDIYRFYPDVIVKEDNTGNTPLHLAVDAGNVDAVKFLTSLDLVKQSIDRTNKDGCTPISYALAKNRTDLIQILLDNGAELHGAALHQAIKQKDFNTVKAILDKQLESDKENENEEEAANRRKELFATCLDAESRSALHIAIDEKTKDIAELLLEKDNKIWADLLRQRRRINGQIRTPFQELIQNRMNDLAKLVLDNCVTTETLDDEIEKPSKVTRRFFTKEKVKGDYVGVTMEPRKKSICIKKELQITHNYEFVDKFSTTDGEDVLPSDFANQISPLDLVVQTDDAKLMTHPVVETLMNFKWYLYGCLLVYLSLVTYVAFMTMFTLYTVFLPQPFEHDEIFDSTCNSPNATHYVMENYSMCITFYWLTIITLAIRLGVEVAQMCFWGKAYLNLRNILQMIFVYAFTIMFLFKWNWDCQNLPLYTPSWQWRFGVVAIMATWFNFASLLRDLSGFRIYVLMFADIFRTYSKFLLFFWIFVMGFALGFYMLFQNQDPYSSLPLTLVKTLVMMIGELDYTSAFHAGSAEHNERTFYPTMAHITFFIFVLIMTILVMNLLTGLAVGDVQIVRSKAELKAIRMRADFLLQLEPLVERCGFRCTVKRLTIEPNTRGAKPAEAVCKYLPQCCAKRLRRWWPETHMKPRPFETDVQEPPPKVDPKKIDSVELKNEIATIKQDMTGMKEENKTLQEKIDEILRIVQEHT